MYEFVHRQISFLLGLPFSYADPFSRSVQAAHYRWTKFISDRMENVAVIKER
jgi:hypothetical protein